MMNCMLFFIHNSVQNTSCFFNNSWLIAGLLYAVKNSIQMRPINGKSRYMQQDKNIRINVQKTPSLYNELAG